MDKERNIYQVDFEKIPSMAFTSPLSYRFYRKREKQVTTWRELYSSILTDLAHLYGDQFHLTGDISILPVDEIGDLKLSKKMKKPISVRRGIYVETYLNTEAILRRIRNILEKCGVPPTHLSIFYEVDEQRKEQYQQRRTEAAEKPRCYVLDWDVQANFAGSSPISYRYKNKNTRQLISWTEVYAQLMIDLMAEYPNKIKNGVSVEGRRSSDICDEKKRHRMRKPRYLENGLFLETFGTTANLIDRMYRFLTLCEVDPGRIVIKFYFDDKQREQEFLEQLPGQIQVDKSRRDVDGKLVRRCRNILRKQFENGFRLESMIDMNRLRASYQKKYKDELPGDEAVIAILQAINRPVNGRVYAESSEEQNIIIETILRDIEDLFSSGASCIYLQSILDIYQDELNEQLNIYTTDALAEMILSHAAKAYSVKRGCLCFGRRKPDAKGEVLSAIKMSTIPVSAEEIASSIWYILKEKVIRILTTSESIVNVSRDSYYYAPNLPVGRSEKVRIRENLKALLDVQDKLTEIEFLNVVLQECPNLLSEASFLSWRGLRDSLLYLFRGTISLDRNVIRANQKNMTRK